LTHFSLERSGVGIVVEAESDGLAEMIHLQVLQQTLRRLILPVYPRSSHVVE
jgi:hypothetical protein